MRMSNFLIFNEMITLSVTKKLFPDQKMENSKSEESSGNIQNICQLVNTELYPIHLDNESPEFQK